MADTRSLYSYTQIRGESLNEVVYAMNAALEQISTSTKELNEPQIPIVYKEPERYVDGKMVRCKTGYWVPDGGVSGVFVYDDEDGWLRVS